MTNEKIYGLKCPVSQKIVYVGRTKLPLEKRLQQHINSHNPQVKMWIRHLKYFELEPEIILIEGFNKFDTMAVREKFWISHYFSLNYNLFNIMLVDGKNNY